MLMHPAIAIARSKIQRRSLRTSARRERMRATGASAGRPPPLLPFCWTRADENSLSRQCEIIARRVACGSVLSSVGPDSPCSTPSFLRPLESRLLASAAPDSAPCEASLLSSARWHEDPGSPITDGRRHARQDVRRRHTEDGKLQRSRRRLLGSQARIGREDDGAGPALCLWTRAMRHASRPHRLSCSRGRASTGKYVQGTHIRSDVHNSHQSEDRGNRHAAVLVVFSQALCSAS
ncbi:hypothetical protein GY45DRAFT_519067 [Cubamyces sp. BRFM 1775]|nr:hypothetical protein GY45DRAFT_519067 [Cubamyces sp. BRFM 1775]